MRFLVDTNVISELRKGERANPGVRSWFESVEDDALYLSVLVIGELRRGVERIRRRDPAAGGNLDSWLTAVTTQHEARILPVTRKVAEAWGLFGVPDPVPVVDALLAATALVHGLTVVTRNEADMARTGVDCMNPFS
ncbi:MAG: type II toxin-antitoxin system VapC family toxin [Deltaproteobacteria bacterium]